MVVFVVGVAVLPVTGASAQVERVVVRSDGWELIGDLRMPSGSNVHPTVLLLNQADGDRRAYEELADLLATRGVASLRLDLRGHGESTNQGRFIPGEHRRDPLIWNADADVAAAYEFLLADGRVDSDRIAVVAASYSGEESVEAGRTHGYAAAYVLLSPGSLSGESIGLLDPSPAQWLIIAAREDPHLADIMAEVSERSERAETLLLDGAGHATDLLEMESDLPSRLVDWLLAHLQ